MHSIRDGQIRMSHFDESRPSRLRILLLFGVVAVVALIAKGFDLWRTTREAVVFEPDYGKVFIAGDIEAFEILLASAPSPAWAREVRIPALVHQISGRGVENRLVVEFVTVGRIREVPSGSPAHILERYEYHNGAFGPPTPSSYRSRREDMRVQVCRVQVTMDRLPPVDGWTLETLVRYRSPWP